MQPYHLCYQCPTSNSNPFWSLSLRHFVVSYQCPTSNRNHFIHKNRNNVLYLISVLHQTASYPLLKLLDVRCILSVSYIKPQLNWAVEND